MVRGVDHLDERVGRHIATVAGQAQLMEKKLPFVFVRELSGRERLPATGERRGGAEQDIPGLAGQGTHSSLQEPRPPQAIVRLYDAIKSRTM